MTFPRWTAALPSTPAAYAGAVVTAWETGDQVALDRLTTETVRDQLVAHPPPAGSGPWPAPECQVVTGQSYCLSAAGGHTVMLRVDDALVAQRAEHAVIEVLFDLPVGPPS